MLELNCSRWDSKPSPLKNVHRSFNHYTSQVLLSWIARKEPKTCLGVHMFTEMEGIDGEERRLMWL